MLKLFSPLILLTVGILPQRARDTAISSRVTAWVWRIFPSFPPVTIPLAAAHRMDL